MNEILKKLESSIISGRAMHAYLLSGTDPDATDQLARGMASLMLYAKREDPRLFDDPDYMEYSGSVSIGEFRDVIRPEIYRETYGPAGRVVVFRRANLLSQALQNAMLKVLEEPPAKTHIILTGSEHGLLPTIRSRCMIIRLPAQSFGEIEELLRENGAAQHEAARFARMSGGVAARAMRLYSSEDARALRDGVINALLAAMRGAPDFKWARMKRDRTDFIEANEILLLVMHDMLLIGCGAEPEFNTDRADELKKTGDRFTIGDFGCIINRLTENALRLSTNSPGGAAFDRLFAEVAELALKHK